MSTAAISKGTKAHVYVLTRHTNGRPTRTKGANVATDMMRQAADHDCLCDVCADNWKSYEHRVKASNAQRSRWARAFLAALDNDLPLPRSKGRGYLDTDAEYRDMNTREAVLAALYEAGPKGLTAAEARKVTGIPGDGISGSLVFLHEAGVADMLSEKR